MQRLAQYFETHHPVRFHIIFVIVVIALLGGTWQVSRSQAAGNPLAGLKLYVDPNTQAAAAYQQAVSQGDTATASQLSKITTQPVATWLSHDWISDTSGTVSNLVAAAGAQGAVAQLVLYDIPHRDCGSYSAGGQPTAAAYRTWIDQVAAAIGSRRALVILEPDVLAGMDCLSAADQSERTGLISYAVTKLKANSANIVYVDAGTYMWQTAETMASRLGSANVAAADGFALNISNFGWASKAEPGWSALYPNLPYNDSQSYGDRISSLTGGKHYVIDTSRNGLGPTPGNSGDWCNPSGKSLGRTPGSATGNTNNDGYLWIKRPGESDGTCNGGPSAGTFWLSYALGLTSRQPSYATPVPTATAAPAATPKPMTGDISGDGKVDIYDLSALLKAWGTNSPAADFNADRTVDIFDLSQLLSHWSR